jgi:pyruvate formate lyase activating enzyme
MESGCVFNIQRYSVQDGPGIRATVFLKGCPLECWWCHNPESQSPRPELIVLEGRCIRCGECVKVCPARKDVEPDEYACRGCGACVEACPTTARRMVGRAMTVGEVVKEVLKDRVFYEESGGGVTFSGGEPLVQARFLFGLLDACRAEGLRTAVDTCGYAPREDLLACAARTDLFLYDLKVMDEAQHREYTGVSNALILENLEALARARARIWLRVPLIPGLNDAPEQLDALAKYAASVPGVEQVNLLPHHETGIEKSRRLGKRRRLGRIGSPTMKRVAAAAEPFRALGLNVRTGG